MTSGVAALRCVLGQVGRDDPAVDRLLGTTITGVEQEGALTRRRHAIHPEGAASQEQLQLLEARRR
jgi:hypothetical protein